MSLNPAWQSMQEIESLRATLRAEVFATDELAPAFAAWLLGRFCNELRFHVQAHWLEVSSRSHERLQEVWLGMATLARQITGEGVNTTLIETIEQTRGHWEATYHSEWHSDVIHQARTDLRQCLLEGQPLTSNLSETDWLCTLCIESTELAQQFKDQLAGSLEGIPRLAFLLGHHADELMHPPMSPRIVTIYREPSNRAGWDGVQDERRPAQEIFLILPNRIVVPWPNIEWWQQTLYLGEQLNRRFGIAPGPFQTRPKGPNSLGSILNQLDHAIDELEQACTDPSQGAGLTRRGDRFARSLGLTVDETNRSISSVQLGTRCRLEPRLFRLFVHFLNQGEEPTTSTLIGENWGRFSPRRTSLAVTSVHSQICVLNNRILQFQITISPADRGYVLSRSPATT